MNLFQKIGNNIYGINGTSFGTTLNNCQVVDYLYQLGFKDNEQIKLDIEQYTGVFTLKDQSLVKYFPSHLFIFNPVSSPTFGGGITFWANGNQVISHRGAGKFQRSSDRGATWVNLPDANVAGVAGNISSSLKNNYNVGRLVGVGNINSRAYYESPSWVYGNMPGNNYWNAVTLASTGPLQTLAVGYDAAAILGAGNQYFLRPIPLGDWKAVVGGLPWDNWIALDTAGRITKTTIPATTWSSPEQLFTAGGYYNPDLALIQGTQDTRYIAVGYNAADSSAELYVSTLVPNNNVPSYNINNLSWKKINIPNGRWFKIANTSSTSDRKTDVIYITEDPDNNQSQNRALVSWDCGENWGVVQLPTENGAKGSIMYLEKSSIFGTAYMRWFVSNGLNHAGYVIPPKLYSGVSLI